MGLNKCTEENKGRWSDNHMAAVDRAELFSCLRRGRCRVNVLQRSTVGSMSLSAHGASSGVCPRALESHNLNLLSTYSTERWLIPWDSVL